MTQTDTAQSEVRKRARPLNLVFDMADKIVAVLATSQEQLSAREVHDAIGCWAFTTIRNALVELDHRGVVQSSLVTRPKFPHLTIRMYAMRQQQLIAAE